MINTNLLDTETLFDAIVTAAMPSGVAAIQDQHADSFGEVPFVSWTALNQGQYDYGLWNVTLVLNVLAHPLEMQKICADVYRAVCMWNMPGEGVMPNVGGVNTVTDSGVFDKINEISMPGKALSQTVATFQLTVQDLS